MWIQKFYFRSIRIFGYACCACLLPLLLAATTSFANVDCENPITTKDMAECDQMDSSAVNKRLNAVYRKVLRGLQMVDSTFAHDYPDRKPLRAAASLVAAQKTWLAYRQQSCQLQGLIVRAGNPSRGGYEGLTASSCETQMASARADELEQLARNLVIPLD